MATVAYEQCGDCDSLLLEHSNSTFECPECNAQYAYNLIQISPGGDNDN